MDIKTESWKGAITAQEAFDGAYAARDAVDITEPLNKAFYTIRESKESGFLGCAVGPFDPKVAIKLECHLETIGFSCVSQMSGRDQNNNVLFMVHIGWKYHQYMHVRERLK